MGLWAYILAVGWTVDLGQCVLKAQLFVFAYTTHALMIKTPD